MPQARTHLYSKQDGLEWEFYFEWVFPKPKQGGECPALRARGENQSEF